VKLYFRDVTGMDLILHRCSCGELNVHGFRDKLVDVQPWRKLAFIDLPCRACNRYRVRGFRLTTKPNTMQSGKAGLKRWLEMKAIPGFFRWWYGEDNGWGHPSVIWTIRLRMLLHFGSRSWRRARRWRSK